MELFKSFFVAALLVFSVCGAGEARPAPDPGSPLPRRRERPLVQVAILLDTSGSMEGLIHQARAHLWSVVSELGRMRRNGERPRLEVALFEYGNSGLPESSGYIRKILELTSDLDRVSEELFKLTTRGGYEYCGEVIQRAVTTCEWSDDDAALKMIFIAGNEPFTQGSVDFAGACRQALRKGITVNTIFCGPRDEGIRTGWRIGAQIGEGEYAWIDHNYVEIHIRSPQDGEILRLNIELNKTYVGFGEKGRQKKALQEEQDQRAATAAPQAALSRVAAKASGMYVNSEWDVVDAARENPSRLEQVPAGELPNEMQGMNAAERRAYAEDLGKKRAEIQKEIGRLTREREDYLRKERLKKTETGGAGLEEAMVQAVRKQAGRKGYSTE